MALNINKKPGDRLSAEEVNIIGQTIDKNTEDIANLDRVFDGGNARSKYAGARVIDCGKANNNKTV